MLWVKSVDPTAKYFTFEAQKNCYICPTTYEGDQTGLSDGGIMSVYQVTCINDESTQDFSPISTEEVLNLNSNLKDCYTLTSEF